MNLKQATRVVLDEATEALRKREGTAKQNIGVWSRGDAAPALLVDLPRWAESRGINSVVWTALRPKFKDEDRAPTHQEVVSYLSHLTGTARDDAERYIRFAPKQIDTPYRRRIEAELHWTPLAPVSQIRWLVMTKQWSEWRPFPDPRKLELLTCPFGPGCYELRDGAQLVLYGMGGHVAERMTCLLPAPFGCGTRNNQDKRKYVLDHLGSIEYRTLACATREEAEKYERELKANRAAYKFQT